MRPPPSRIAGFYLVTPTGASRAGLKGESPAELAHHADRAPRIAALLARDGLQDDVLPLSGKAARAGQHRYGAVHETHLEALRRCGDGPCLVLEDDAEWQPRAIHSAVADAEAERPDFDLLLLQQQLTPKDAKIMGTKMDVRNRTARVVHTACGCAGYYARNASALIAYLSAHPVRRGGSGVCIEDLDTSQLHAVLPLKQPVTQFSNGSRFAHHNGKPSYYFSRKRNMVSLDARWRYRCVETWLNESRPAIAAHRLPTLREMKGVRAWKEVQGGT